MNETRKPLPTSQYSGTLPPGGLYWRDNMSRQGGLNRWQKNHFRLMALIEYREGVIQGAVERLLTRLGVKYRKTDYVPTNEEIVEKLAPVEPEIMRLIALNGKVATVETLLKQQYDLKGKYRNYFQGGRLPNKVTLDMVDEYLGETGAAKKIDSYTMAAYTRRMSGELAAVARRHIEETVAQGTALNWSRGRTQEELARRFQEEQSKRQELDMSKTFPNVETVVRTESMKISNAEAWNSALRVSSYGDDLWGFTYNAVGDSRTRDTHLAQDEVSAPVNDPFWDEWTPPNGYNCRCWLVSEFDEPDTIKPPHREIKPDKGFSFNPAKQIHPAQSTSTTKSTQTTKNGPRNLPSPPNTSQTEPIPAPSEPFTPAQATVPARVEPLTSRDHVPTPVVK